MIVSLLNTRHSKTSKSKTCNYLIHLISENFVKVNIDVDSLLWFFWHYLWLFQLTLRMFLPLSGGTWCVRKKWVRKPPTRTVIPHKKSERLLLYNIITELW